MNRTHLFSPTDLGIPGLTAQFERLDAAPEKVANINIVPFIGESCLIIVTPDGADIPGGTLEPGETYSETARRELLEETGAHLLDLRVFGGWKCHSSAPKPF
ncbi:MAG: NUDIX domain-containing protein, partial [Taibaiella sp.]|nr:NUDIX domain-containing protein [Taibaiella sp.]